MATYYCVAAGNFNSASTWASSSGGAGGAGTPGPGDACILDGNTPSGPTISASQTIGSLDCSAFTGTLNRSNSSLTIDTGDVVLSSGMTYADVNTSQNWAFSATAGTQTLTSAGHTLGNITKTNAGVFTLGDALTMLPNATLNITSGTFDNSVGNYNVTCGIFNGSNSNTRTIKLGSAIYTILMVGNSVTSWSLGTTTGLTFDAGTSQLKFRTTGVVFQVSLGNNNTYYDIEFSSSVSHGMGYMSAMSGVSCNQFRVVGPFVLLQSGNSGLTAANFDFDTSTGLIVLCNRDAFNAQRFVLTLSGGGQISMDKVAIQSSRPGTSTTFIATNSYDLGNNSSITITPPGGGAPLSRIFTGM